MLPDIAPVLAPLGDAAMLPGPHQATVDLLAQGSTWALLGLFFLSATLEDVGIAIGAGIAVHGAFPWWAVFAVVCCGVFFGDAVTYTAGRLAHRWPWLQRQGGHPRAQWVLQLLRNKPVQALIIGRVVIGLRTPVYALAGFAGVPARTFFSLDALSVVIFVAVAASFGVVVGHPLARATGLPPGVATSAALMAVVVLWMSIHALVGRLRR